MSFYGKDPEEPKPERMRKYRVRRSDNGEWATVSAHNVYFYESGHAGFWIDLPDNDRQLIWAGLVSDIIEEAP